MLSEAVLTPTPMCARTWAAVSPQARDDIMVRFDRLVRNWRTWRPPPINLRIAGVEVIQAVQRFAFGDPDLSNSVPLVAYKRTMARVYIAASRPIAVSGSLTIEPEGIGGMVTGIAGPGGTASVSYRPVVWPTNPGGTVLARPQAEIDRLDLNHSLDFLLPVGLLVGPIRLNVEVHVPGILGLWIRAHDSSTVAAFHIRKLPKKLVWAIAVNGGVPAPTWGDYFRCLQQVVARFPAPDHELLDVEPLAGHVFIENNDDLSENVVPVILQLDQLVPAFDKEHHVLTVLLATRQPGGAEGGSGVPGTPVIFQDEESFPHELAHSFHLGHSEGDPHSGSDPRGIPAVFDLPDNDMVAGVDLNSQKAVGRHTSEMMGYLSTSPTWISPKSWQLLFEAFAP
jgi:hypothetical protein